MSEKIVVQPSGRQLGNRVFFAYQRDLAKLINAGHKTFCERPRGLASPKCNRKESCYVD